jgi:hypothetical protein
MFAYQPSQPFTPAEIQKYEPTLKPFKWELEEPTRLFDYIDYNPLRNLQR